MHARNAFQYLLLLTFVHLCDRVFLMTGWVCQWKPFWIPVGDTFQKAYLEEWQHVDDGPTRDPGENSTKTVPCAADSMRQRRAENNDCAAECEQLLDTSSAPKSSWQAVGEPDAPTWKLSGTQGTSLFSVLCHEVLSDFNCGQESCISTKFAHSVLL